MIKRSRLVVTCVQDGVMNHYSTQRTKGGSRWNPAHCTPRARGSPRPLHQLGVLAGAAVIPCPWSSCAHPSGAGDAEDERSPSPASTQGRAGGTARWDDIYSSCCCCLTRRGVRGSGADGEMLSASEWRLPRRPRFGHVSEQQEPAGLLWALAQVLQAASPGQFGCRWQSPCLPKCAAGSASGQGWKSQQRSRSGRAALSKLLGDSVTVGESLARHPQRGGQNNLCCSLTSTLRPFLCQARRGESQHHELGPTHTLLWDQSRTGAKPPGKHCPCVPLHTVP